MTTPFFSPHQWGQRHDPQVWGEGGAWSPTHFGTNLQMWWDASDAASFGYGTGTLVAQWNDLSGKGRHLTSPEDYFRPSRSGTLNSKPTVVSIGAAAGGHAYMQASFSTIPQPMTYFLVVKVRSDGNYHPVYDSVGTDEWNHLERFGDNNMRQTSHFEVAFAMDANWHYLTLCYHLGTSYVRVDGVNQTVAGNPGEYGQHGMTVFANRAQASGGTEIAELFGVNLDVTGSDQTSAENYLKTKWGL